MKPSHQRQPAARLKELSAMEDDESTSRADSMETRAGLASIHMTKAH